MVAVGIFSLLVVAVFQVLGTASRAMKADIAKDSAEAVATRLIDALGRDIRESSYAYVYAGDWMASRDGTGVIGIDVARNYFSSQPWVGGSTLAPGISDEGWSQCTNATCTWAYHPETSGMTPTWPMAFLTQPTRNNIQSVAPVFPPTGFTSIASDARGRMFGHIASGGLCPYCGSTCGDEVFFGGLMIFSPRRQNHTFSYGGLSGYEPQWESMVFYAPLNDGNGIYGIRRYQFFAETITDGGGNPASLVDLLDLDANGIIESPPMTDQAGNFVLDADVEQFGLPKDTSMGGNVLYYYKLDSASSRSFEIKIDRTSGQANVLVGGGAFAGSFSVRTEMRRFGLGCSNFIADTFLNNPSWFVSGVQNNPFGVVELGVVRIVFQVDRPGNTTRGGLNRNEETVQVTMQRPRN